MGTLQKRSLAALAFAVPLHLAATLPEHVAQEKRRRAPYLLFIKGRA
jgi:hypothetical protein